MQTKKKSGSYIVLLLLIFGLSAVMYGMYSLSNVFEPILISGSSMYPTLKEGEKYPVLHTDEITNGDIVSFISPEDSEMYFVKRVIGVSGDSIEYINDELFLNGKYVDEPYLEELKSSERATLPVTPNFSLETLTSTQQKVVPEGYYFVMGDNRIDSKDSRYFGFIHKDTLVGKVYMVTKK